MIAKKTLPLLLAVGVIAFIAVSAHGQNPNGKNNVDVSQAVRHDLSRPLREMTPIPPEGNKAPHEHPVKPIPQPDQGNVPVKDNALQTAATVVVRALLNDLAQGGLLRCHRQLEAEHRRPILVAGLVDALVTLADHMIDRESAVESVLSAAEVKKMCCSLVGS